MFSRKQVNTATIRFSELMQQFLELLVHQLGDLYGSLKGNNKTFITLQFDKKASQKCMIARIER